jgi:predicted RNA-binding protein (virulence factor B family)
MATLGKRAELFVIRCATPGVYLDGGELGEILLPGRYVPQGTIPGQSFDVFVHRDSEDRLVATTETSYGEVGDFAALQVISTDPHRGAFLDWGLSKDLLLPIREQAQRVDVGQRVVVYISIDQQTDRIVASSRLNRHLNQTPANYRENQPVKLLIAGPTTLGYNAIIENAHMGLLYHNELPAPIEIGQQLDGFVRSVRPDGKIDLSLNAAGYKRVAPLKDQILEKLTASGGKLPYSDKSTPDEIWSAFACSKKAYKQAIGALFKERKIVITDHGIAGAGPGALSGKALR